MKPWLLVVIALAMFSCQGKSSRGSSEVPKETEKTVVEKTFRRPTIPSFITEPSARMEYAVLHYWDLFDFGDTAFIASQSQMSEQALIEYLQMLNMPNGPSYEVISESISQMLSKAEVDTMVYRFWVDLYRKYLYDPNSPIMNDELYLPVLQSMTTSSVLTPTQQQTAMTNWKVVSRNRPGTPAADFRYTLLSGKQSSLYAMQAEYLLLFFNNPGCHACGEIKDAILQSSVLGTLIDGHRLKVLAVYPDEDLTEWRNHYNDIPASWTNAYDRLSTIKKKELYDLKAIPMLYLLDKDKKVLLKDCQVNQLIDYFQE